MLTLPGIDLKQNGAELATSSRNTKSKRNVITSKENNLTSVLNRVITPANTGQVSVETASTAQHVARLASSFGDWSGDMNSVSMIDDEMQVIDTIDQSYWNGKFVPPPPRPPFLEESIAPDGLTTCDLCSWAWQDKGTLSLDGAIKEIFSSSDTKEFNWTFALIVVSLTSAVLGAIIMIVFLRCKRIRTNQNGLRALCFDSSSTKDTSGLNFDNQTSKNSTNGSCSPRSTNSGLWTWFSSRKNLSTPDQLVNSHTLPVENHYTHMDDNNYNPVQIDEASYAEVGNEIGPSETTSYKSGSVHHGTDNDILIMSCPLPAIPAGSHSASGGASGSGSAYYSGLLNNGNMAGAEDEDERPYEIVDLKEMSSPHKNPNVQSHFLNETNNLLTIEKHSEALPEGTISASDYV
uniref:Uncharacterized protein n=1 Tax=Anopheles farauti TaxID=69004 RepID=A0A182QGF2_9DIPT